MNGKKLAILVSVVVVAILAIVLSENLSNKRPPEQSLKFFSDKNIGSVVIKDATGTVTLKKKGDVWFVSAGTNVENGSAAQPLGTGESQQNTGTRDFSTDSASVTVALEKLSNMKKEVLVSENKDKQSLFEVDTVKGTFVEVFDPTGKSKGALLIGKSGPDWNSNYVRMLGSNQVYTVTGGIKYSFFTDVKRWRDKLMLSFDKASAKNISIVKKDGTAISLTKADSGSLWNMVTPENCAAKTDQVDAMLSTLSRFNASDFEDVVQGDSALGFTTPELTAMVTLPGGTKKITIGAKRPDGKYNLKVDGKETVFIVNESDFSNLNKDVASLKADAVPAAPTPLVNNVNMPQSK